MSGAKYSKFLTILLVLIIVAIIGLLGYLGYNYYTNYTTANDADQYVSTFIEEVGETDNNKTTEETTSDGADISEGIETVETTGSNGKSTVKTYKGYPVIGTIEIPSTNIKYPILNDPPTVKKLETSVAALYPQNAQVNTVGNVVIVGHNYRNGLFFSNNKKLKNGDKIYITDLSGKKVTYVVYNVFQAAETDTSFFNRDTDGAMEITLSTCTDDSSARIIVEAKAQ